MRHKLKACGCWAISLAVILSGLIVVTTPGRLAAGNCEFVLGFKFLHDLEGSAVGDCVGNQAFGANGDALQPTTKGLLVWRKADNFTAFTNGYESWVSGPFGVQERLNSQRFWWEGNAGPQLTGLAGQFLAALNGDRLENGLRPLSLDEQLTSLAQQRAQGLLSAGTLSHYDADGNLIVSKLLAANHVRYIRAGENLAENNYPVSQTVQKANRELMDSPTHR